MEVRGDDHLLGPDEDPVDEVVQQLLSGPDGVDSRLREPIEKGLREDRFGGLARVCRRCSGCALPPLLAGVGSP